MYRTYVFLGLLLACGSLLAQEEQIRTDSIEIYFATASQTLEPQEIAKVRAFVETIPFNKTFTLAVKGYTDNRGNKEFNLRLSRQRALAVQNLLEYYGVEPDQFQEVSGRGEIDPTANEQDAQKNRKVTIRLYRPKAEVIAERIPKTVLPDAQRLRGLEVNPIKTPAPKPIEVNTCNEIAAVYTLENGALVTLGACCFGDLSPQDVKVQLEPINSPAEMIAYDIQTITIDGYYLSSAGMLMVTLRDPAGNLITQTGGEKCMTIRIPAKTKDPYLRIYYAFQRNEQERIAWQSSLNKPDFRQIDGKPYYEIRTQRPIGVSFQKPLDYPREAGLKRMYVQVKGYDAGEARVYLSGNQTAVGGRWDKSGLAYFRLPAIPFEEAYLSVVVETPAGKMLLHKRLNSLKQKKGPNKQPLFQVKKKDFIPMANEDMILQYIEQGRS